MNESPVNERSLILAVDDDPDQLDLISHLLRYAGFTVRTASDALTGLDLAKKISPDLVISDVAMPNTDGIEFCNMIRADLQLAGVPVLLVSAIRKDTETIIQALQTGADDYLEIPYEPAILIAKAIRLVEVNRIADRLHEEKERLRLAIAAARMDLWEWNILTGRVHWFQQLEGIQGCAPGSFSGTLESYLDQVVPEDRELVESSLRKTVDEGSDHDIEYRVMSPDNEIHWVEGRGAVIRNRSGKPAKNPAGRTSPSPPWGWSSVQKNGSRHVQRIRVRSMGASVVPDR